MNSKFSFFLFSVLICSLLFTSCKSKKSPKKELSALIDSISVASENLAVNSEFYEQFLEQNISTEFLSSKAKMEIKTSDGKSFNLTFNFIGFNKANSIDK